MPPVCALALSPTIDGGPRHAAVVHFCLHLHGPANCFNFLRPSWKSSAGGLGYLCLAHGSSVQHCTGWPDEFFPVHVVSNQQPDAGASRSKRSSFVDCLYGLLLARSLEHRAHLSGKEWEIVDARIRVQGLGFRVQGSGFRV